MGYYEIGILAVTAFFSGVICTIVFAIFLFKLYLESGPIASPPKCPQRTGPVVLPEELVSQLKEEEKNFRSGSPRSSLVQGNENLAINLTLQFLFNELRNSERVRLWLYRKLNTEFKELLNSSTTGKLFDSVQLRDLNLGNQFPTIKGLDVAEAKICADTGLLETLDLSLDLHYSGNFQMSIDVKMKLSKYAFLSVQVKRVTGKARLQFTRVPYTHWSLSFYTEPILELAVESQFQGRQLQPQIINLITNQIRKAVRRKHTLPRYKLRYKPFFRRLNEEAVDLSEGITVQAPPGILDVTLLEVSRLNIDPNLFGAKTLSEIEVYCTVSIDTTPWISLTLYNDITYMVLDLIVSKTSSQQLGVVFKQEYINEIGQICVVVETIVCNSPAAIAELRKGDIIVAVNGKKVSNMNQIAKLIKSATQRRFIVRVERKYTNTEKQTTRIEVDKYLTKKPSKSDFGVGKSDTLYVDDSFKSIKFSDLKDVDSDVIEKNDSGSKLFKRRKSNASTVTEDSIQAPDTPSRKFVTNSSLSSGTSNFSTYTIASDTNSLNFNELVYTSKEKELSTIVTIEERISFNVESDIHYLNIGIWAKLKNYENPAKLVGYINAPINLILAQCATSSNGNYIKCHALLPPDSASTSVSKFKLDGYSGFDPTLCYGDILLAYNWVSSRPSQKNIDINKKLSNNEEIPVTRIPTALCTEDTTKKAHDFIRTHFQRATNCDFCSKKIWLNNAIQCRNCGMFCHKKCETRCQTLTSCGAESIATLADEADETELTSTDNGPEISLTNVDENIQGASMMAMRASIASTILGLKKAGSTSCLAPPNPGIGLASRSLPPSPCASRKSSLVGGGLGISPDLLEGADPSVAAPLIAGELDDGLMNKAKDTGKFIYKNLEPNERIHKINSMMTKLKASLDTETSSRRELSQNFDTESNKMISQSDLRVQALSVLLLHYCTGLQHAQEQIDRPNGGSFGSI